MASLRDLGRGAGFGCAAALALAACSHDTTILVRITRDASVPAAVPRVHLAIGIKLDGDVVAPATTDPKGATDPAYLDDTATGELIDTSGVDLASAPYELEIKPSAQFAIDTGLELAAVGFDGDTADRGVIGFGAIGHEVHFHRGDTLVYEITLTAVSAPAVDPGRRDCGTFTRAGGALYACKRGCVRFAGDAGAIWIGAHDDVDCDGDARGSDCDDLDWTVNHMATDVCGNGKNDDCVGGVDDGVDRDGDGFTPCTGDCVDNPSVPHSKDIHPGALDLPNGIDDNCSGACDEGDDVDGDTFTKSGFRTTSPQASDRTCAAATPDCNDLVGTIHPGATEIDGNGFDDDCDGTCDVDADGDGFTAGNGTTGVQEPPAAGTAQCVLAVADCDDDPAKPENGTPAAQIHPGAPELCDGVDDNCNGKCDEGLDTDGDHFTVCGTVDVTGAVCTYAGAATCAGNGAACDCAEGHPNIFPGGPALELCDGLDEGCDGVRFASDAACFALDGAGTCRVGSRTCDDSDGGAGFGPCIAGNVAAPPEACNQFGSCATDPDPIACVAKKLGNAANVGCQASLDKAAMPIGLCPAPPASYVVLLPAVNGTTLCNQADWFLIGGTQHGAWSIGLTDPAQAAAPSATVLGQCQANLIVTQVMGGGVTGAPPPTTLLLLVRRPLSIVPLVFDLQGAPVMPCPDGSAMLCHMSG